MSIKLCPFSEKDRECYNWCGLYLGDVDDCALADLAVSVRDLYNIWQVLLELRAGKEKEGEQP